MRRSGGILKSETLLSDLTFRFACESFPDFPAYIASVMTGDEISVRDVRVQQRLMNPGGRDIVTDVMVYGEDGSVYDIETQHICRGLLDRARDLPHVPRGLQAPEKRRGVEGSKAWCRDNAEQA